MKLQATISEFVATAHLDLEGEIQSCNELFAELVDGDTDNLVGATIEQAGMFRHVMGEWLRTVQGSADPVHLSTQVKTGAGRRFQVATVAQVVDDHVFLAAIPAVLTKRDARHDNLEEMEDQEFRRALVAGADVAGIGIAINVVDEHGSSRLAFINKAGADMLGRSPDTLRNGPPFPPRMARDIKQSAIKWPTKEGDRVIEVGMASGHYWGQQASFVFFQDVTERTQIEAERDRLLNQVEKAHQDLQDFTRGTTHDLRAPLRSISGFATLLERRMRDRIGPSEVRLIDSIVQGSRRMDELLDALTHFAAVGAHDVEATSVDLNDVIGEVIADLSFEISAEGIRVEVDALPVIEGDRLLLRQLLQNLVGNALKFRRSDEHTVGVEADVDDEAWILAVYDTGIGMDLDKCQGLFQPFKRFHDRQRYPGSGIGLATCKRITEMHGGSITVDSKPGEGSRFTVRIPKRSTHSSEP